MILQTITANINIMKILIKKNKVPGRNPDEEIVVDFPRGAYDNPAAYDIKATSVKFVGIESLNNPGYWERLDYIQYGTGLFIAPQHMFDLSEPFGKLSEYHTEAFPRSSNSDKNLIMCNSVGTIDTDYRGEIIQRFKYIWQPEDLFWHVEKVTQLKKTIGLINEHKIYHVGDKIIQLKARENIKIDFEWVDELPETKRGDGGFGSSGK